MKREEADQVIEAINRRFRDEIRDSPVSRETPAWNRVQVQREALVNDVNGFVTEEGA